MAIKQKPTGLPLTHKATDRAAKLVVKVEVGLTLINPLGVNLLCSNLNNATEYKIVLARLTFNKPIHSYMQA